MKNVSFLSWKSPQKWGFWLLLVIIYFSAWLLQNAILLNADVGWLLLVTKRLLLGGTYSHDFFEVNPPMVLYLYSPIVLLSKVIPIPIENLFRIYIFILASLSIFLSHSVLTKSMGHNENRIIFATFILTLAGIFLILPLGDFGQREHLCVILTFPYMMLMVGRFNGIAFSNSTAILVGILAGLGFAIKPYFLIVFILIECVYLVQSYYFLAWIRVETRAIFSILVIYALLIFSLHWDYITVIVPLITQFYYQDVAARLSVVILNPFACFYYFSVILFFIRYPNNEYKELSSVVALAATGFFLAYLMQQTIWYYHILPMFSLSFLLFTLLLSSLLKQKNITRLEYLQLFLFFVIVCLYIIFHASYIWMAILYYPTVYFSMFLFLFSLILYNITNHLLKITGILLIIFIVNFLFYQNIQHTYLHQHIFLFSVLLFTMFFIWVIPNASFRKIINPLVVYSIGLPIFLFSFFQIGYIYNGLEAYKKLISPLIGFINNAPQKAIVFFSDSNEFAFPAVNYANHSYSSRFGCLTWVPLFKNDADSEEYKYQYYGNQKLMDFYIDDVVDDIQHNKPGMILVDSRGKGYIGIVQPDYIKFFSQKKSFRQIWKKYHYVQTITGKPLYKFDVYKL